MGKVMAVLMRKRNVHHLQCNTPFMGQVAMCEQLAVYLAKFKTPVAVTGAADSSAAVTAAPPEGYKVRPLQVVLPRWLSLALSFFRLQMQVPRLDEV